MLVARRSYDNSRRDEKARQTRENVLDAVIEALARHEEQSIADLAKAAGVSVPTVYRHFPTREALMDAVQKTLGARLKRPPWKGAASDIVGHLRARYGWLEENGTLMRAILATPLGAELLRAVRRRREAAMTRAMAPRVASLQRRQARAITAIASVLDDAQTWRLLRDEWNLPIEDATWAAEWAMRALLENLERGSP